MDTGKNLGRVYDSAEELIGGTPMVRLRGIEEELGLSARLLGKLEYLNPAGSVKDRAAKAMLDDAERRGVCRPGGTIIEPTSGNTGIGLCAVAARRGYKVIIVMPDTMSRERRQLMRAYGARLELTRGCDGMAGAISRAQELCEQIPGSFIPSQFDNPANPAAHMATTGPEIWRDTGGELDAFVAGVGTGGTITGVGRYLKSKKTNVEIVAVEPEDSPLLSRGTCGPHGIQGIGANFVPAVLDRNVYDRVVAVPLEEAYRLGRLCGRREGILIGISSGAALWAAVQLCAQPEYNGKTVVTLLPDGGERYLSTEMFGQG